MKRLMSKLVKKASGLPDTMFISGVAVPRGQCSIGGTFGDIYKTLYKDQPVALKFLRILGSSPAEKRKTCKKFYKEALVWRKLDFKYVLPFLGVDTENIPGRPCMVSPWMANGNAHDFVKNHPKMNVDKLLFEIAQGIQYLHSKFVVHGDIKGLNILIDEQWHPRLADFGLTIWADVSKQDTTQRGGTVRWMAPELLHPTSFGQEDSQRTFATDVYAYGCVCLELHTRDKPFYDIHSEGVVSVKVAKGERPQRPTDPPFADELWNLVKACWQQETGMRPQSAEIVEVLRSIFRKSALEGGLDVLLRSGTALSVGEHSGSERGSLASIFPGPLQDEPDDARLQTQLEFALLQIRQHADPNRAYFEKRKLHKG
ncbi:kinase-like domain-containing protein [Mucidula mucida]|nr:kinase-like domain-containing protein [Mucidula mucida]